MEVEGADHCVSVDKDGDGIPNATDQCPDQAEDFNGYKDEDGCPDEPERLAMVKAAHDREAAAQLAAQQEAERQRQVAAAEEARRQAILAEQKRAADAAAESARLAQVAAEEARVAKANARTSRRRAGYALTSIGLAFGVTSGVFMGLGAGENSTIKSGGFASASDIASADSSGKTYNAAAIATGVLGILGVGIGAPLILADLPTHEATEPPPPSARAGDVFLTPTAGGLSVHGVF
jgi:type IV secretory pathway VirB10-like protein